ncbi:MAG: SUMF1/EgtB/PvdO family nonheme iron enzyme, partial [Planctomycetota bacterium]
AKLLRRVAVRVPGPRAVEEEGFVDRFERSVRSVSDLRHEALVGVVDFGEHAGVPLAILDYVPGTSLRAHLEAEGGRMTAGEVASWLGQVAAALDYLHGKGEAHGNVCLDTVLLDKPPSTKAYLADFTVDRARADRKATARSDQRDLAAAAFVCLTGTTPPTAGSKRESVTGVSEAALAPLERARGDAPFDSCTALASAFAAGAAAGATGGAASPRAPMPTRTDSETLGFGRPRPAAPGVPAGAPGSPERAAEGDAHATREVVMRGRRRGSNALVLVFLAVLLVGAVVFVISRSGKGRQVGTAAQDDVPPAIEIVTPVEGFRTRETEVAVRGRTDDPRAIVLVDENPVKVKEDGSFEATTRIPKEGDQVIVVMARDESGNETRVTVTVNRDATPPALEITGPTPRALATAIIAPSVRVTGRVGEAGAEVEVAGEAVPVEEDGTFAREVPIPRDGENAIEIVARDPVGNVARRRIVVLRRLVVCCDTLEITAPLDGTATRESEIEVVGLMEDPRASVTIDGEPAVIGRDGVFRGSVKLEAEGDCEITVRAWDAGGHKGVAHVRITRDLTPPVLELSKPRIWARSPGETFGTSVGPLKLPGTVRDATRCRVYANGVRGSVRGDTWKATVTLSVGEKYVRLWSVDAAGNRCETQRYRVFVPREEIRGLTYKGTNESGYEEYTLDQDPTVVLVLVPGGGYRRGAPPEDPAASPDERPRQRVMIGAFFLGVTEVTWAQYLRFCRASNHQLPPGASEANLLLDHPVTQITWEDARAYCKWAGVRLPTESEWEYAARFGAEGSIWPWTGGEMESLANVAGVRGNATAVATYPDTGELGLFDMVGNAAEWCADWYAPDAYRELPGRDPKGPSKGTLRVVRGGSWQDPPKGARLSARHGLDPASRLGTVGFRIAADVPRR